MSAEIVEQLDLPFEIDEPKAPFSPVVCNSPHSGRFYPASFLAQSRLELSILRRSEDTFVDELFADSVRLGVPMMRAHFPRSFLDVNREPYELDPRMFDGRLPPFANTRSLRVAGGLGTIARVVGDAREIYERRLPVDEALTRIERYYKPYHRELRRLITRAQQFYDFAVLLDCHSMPSNASSHEERARADIVIGDRYGTSCAPVVSDINRGTPCAASATAYSATSPMPAASSPNITAIRPPDFTRCRSRSTGRSTWDERAYRRSGRFEYVRADIGRMIAKLAIETARGIALMRDAAE